MGFMARTVHPILDAVKPYVCSLPFTAFTLVLLCGLGVVFTIFGSYCVDKCNLEDGRIEIFLIVNGIVLLLIGILRGIHYVLHRNLSANYTIEEPPTMDPGEPGENEGGREGRKDGTEVHHESTLMKVVGLMLETLAVFLLVWFIIGCLWVYRSHNRVQFTDTSEETYCQKECYLFSFWSLTVHFMLIGLIILLGIVVSGCFVWRERKIDYPA